MTLTVRPLLCRRRTFYQISTRIEVVYVVSMPAEVKVLLNALTPAFSLSIDSFGLPLQCLSLVSRITPRIESHHITRLPPSASLSCLPLYCVAAAHHSSIVSSDATAPRGRRS